MQPTRPPAVIRGDVGHTAREDGGRTVAARRRERGVGAATTAERGGTPAPAASLQTMIRYGGNRKFHVKNEVLKRCFKFIVATFVAKTGVVRVFSAPRWQLCNVSTPRLDKYRGQ
jgi:hypothetical protein